MHINWQKYSYGYLVVFLVLYSFSVFSYAAKVIYNVDASLAHHDNINLEPNTTSEEWVEELTGRLLVTEDSSNLIANVDASLSVLHYENQLEQDTLTGELYADGLWIIKPNHFEWFGSDVFTQTLVDPLQSNTQANRQDTNISSTGPNYYLRLNKLNNLNFEARVGRVTYSDTNQDNNRSSVAVRWLYQANSAMTDSINYEVEKLDFDVASFEDYYRHNLYARVDYKRARNTYAVEAGVTKIDYKTQKDLEGQRYLVSLENQRTRNSSILLRYSHQITDTGADILSSALNTSVATASLTQAAGATTVPVADIYTDDTVSFEYNKKTLGTSLFFNLVQSEQDFKTQNTSDQKSTTIEIVPTYNFNRVSYISLEANYIKTRFINVTPLTEDVDTSIKVIYSRKLSRNKMLNFSYEKLMRDSTVAARNYRDNIAMVLFRYTSI